MFKNLDSFVEGMGLIDYFRDLIGINISRTLENIENEAVHRLNVMTGRVVNRVIREIVSIFLILFAVALLSIACVFLFIEYFALTKTVSFLIVGIIVLFFALIIKMMKGG